MAELLAVRATITKIFEGYSLTLVMKKNRQSRLLLDERAASVFEAEAVQRPLRHYTGFLGMRSRCCTAKFRAPRFQTDTKPVVA